MKAIVVGGGIGGLTTAIALRRIGAEVVVHERAAELREVGAGITVWFNAIRALESIGAADAVVAAGVRLVRAEIRNDRGRPIIASEVGRFSDRFGHPTVALHRASLHDALRRSLPADVIRVGSELVGVETDRGRPVARFADGRTDEADLIVGADGIRSAVRRSVAPDATLRYAGYGAWRGVTPALPEPVTAAVELWGSGARFGIVPIDGGRLYWFCAINEPEESRADFEALARRVGTFADPVPALLDAARGQPAVHTPIHDLEPFRPWFRGAVVLVGDAAHATTPNLGQGACMAIESAVTLARCLADASDVPAALARYQEARWARCAWITNQSWSFGRLGQLESRRGRAIRDWIVGHTPVWVSERQMMRIGGVR